MTLVSCSIIQCFDYLDILSVKNFVVLSVDRDRTPAVFYMSHVSESVVANGLNRGVSESYSYYCCFL